MDVYQYHNHPEYPIRTRRFRITQDLEQHAKDPNVRRLLRVISYQFTNAKAIYAGSFRGYNPPAIRFELVAKKVDGEYQLSFFRAAKRLAVLLRKRMLPFVQKHQETYLKDADGGGGSNLARLFEEDGELKISTSNTTRHALSRIESLRAFFPRSRKGRTGIHPELRKALSSMCGITYEEPIAPTEAVFSLGKIKTMSQDVLHALASAITATMLQDNVNLQNLLLQKAIPHLKTAEGKPVEFRFVLQRHPDGKYRVTYHYGKIGASPFASNIGLEGKRVPTHETLIDLLRIHHPQLKPWQCKQMADRFIQSVIKRCEAFMQKDALNHQATKLVQVGDNPRQLSVMTPPLLSTIDVVAVPTERDNAGIHGVSRRRQLRPS